METFEDQLQWRLPVDRFNVACGFYGDTQWQLFTKDGEYVEYTDHQAIVNIYAAEVARLRQELESARLT